jgi:hypothetical protein
MNIGDYIRTPFGITKCINKQQIIIEDNLFCETKYGYLYYLEDYDDEMCNITDSNLDEYKHSENIIDLIEVGDYVNGYKITDYTEIDKYNDEKILYADLNVNSSSEYIAIHNEDIKSIVTKEQFESMEYKVVE